MSRPLTPQDKVAAFKVATGSFARYLEDHGVRPMNDELLESTLRHCMGIMAGTCGPGRMDISWQGAGLKIWASWEIANIVKERPIFAGTKTLAAAREVYGIRRPGDEQLSLF
ncbi:hypothetical protein QO010_003362 [Caulobacter ginsengisoli]|uniref:Uncharacterized protein n=1 Tax=Caulobacter ginsengisoli TaxID=400775 RepID=A0ABU0IU86_9CAUL|nr:hypothetical protein [Caulobacter ginsengisoli]MDQ0465573.1 hypothetical protein [Caulobacter ginsengisoli]